MALTTTEIIMLQSVDSVSPIIGNACEIKSIGMTKREYFAAMAMQGILAAHESGVTLYYAGMALNAVECADALIKELEKTNEKS